MTPAAWPRAERLETRLLHVDPARAALADRRMRDLPELLRRGDLLIVNDAATLPAALAGVTRRGPIEVRLAALGAASHEWSAVLFGAGSWRQRTEDRSRPTQLASGDPIAFAAGLGATVTAVSESSPRLVTLAFDLDAPSLWSALYRAGHPVQYSYLCGPLALWHVQTPYASRPWAVEMPSAGWALDPGMLVELRRRGIGLASVTHAAGLSSTGDAALDAMLPLPERYEIPGPTVHEVERTRARGGRVVAVGTTVVRALEGCALQNGGALCAGTGVTDWRAGPGFVPAIADGLLTGMHEPRTSHFDVLAAFASRPLLEVARLHAENAGYLDHEFGDTSLILAA